MIQSAAMTAITPMAATATLGSDRNDRSPAGSGSGELAWLPGAGIVR